MSHDFDIFGHKDHHHDGHRSHNDYDHHRDYDQYHSYRHHGHGLHPMYLEMAKKILANKTLLFLGIAILFIIVALGIWIISLILPILGQLLSVVEKQGIKGAVDTISPYLMKLWEGTGK